MPASGGSLSDTNVPTNKVVDGQSHNLAYITPNEADQLVALGGKETMTEEGIPAYPPGMGDPAYAAAESSTNQGPAGGASAGGDYGGNVNPDQTYAGHTVQDQRDYRADPEGYTEKQNQVEQDLTWKQHWDNRPAAIKSSITLSFLYATGKNIGEWAAKKGWGSATGTNMHEHGGGDNESQMMHDVAPHAPYIVSGTTKPTNSPAANWFSSSLGNTSLSGSNFNMATEYAAAKAKQKSILGSPSPVGQLAVNNSPFYNWLKDKNLDKGIL